MAVVCGLGAGVAVTGGIVGLREGEGESEGPLLGVAETGKVGDRATVIDLAGVSFVAVTTARIGVSRVEPDA